MTLQLADIPVVSDGDIDHGAVDYTSWLDEDEVLTGTPTVSEQVTADLTISGAAVNTTTFQLKGRTIAIGKAVQFTFTGQDAGESYSLLITATTDSGRTKKVIARFRTAD